MNVEPYPSGTAPGYGVWTGQFGETPFEWPATRYLTAHALPKCFWRRDDVDDRAVHSFDPGGAEVLLDTGAFVAAVRKGWQSREIPTYWDSFAVEQAGVARTQKEDPVLWRELACRYLVPQELNDGSKELAVVRSEAAEEGYPVPSYRAQENARGLLLSDLPADYEIYPTPDGAIAIDIPGGRGQSVIVMCDADGSVGCYVNLPRGVRRARYENGGSLPDGFLREALDELRLSKSTN